MNLYIISSLAVFLSLQLILLQRKKSDSWRLWIELFFWVDSLILSSLLFFFEDKMIPFPKIASLIYIGGMLSSGIMITKMVMSGRFEK